MKKWLIILVGLTVALAAITSGGFILASNENGDYDHDVPNEWKLVEASGWPGGFSLRLPQEWQLNELQGIDSYVGEIVWDGGRLNFDFGWYSSPLVDDDDPQYIVTYEEIGGRGVKMVRPRVEGEALITGVYFEDFDDSNLDIPSQNRLQISGVGLSPDQQETAFSVFRTIRPVGSESQGESEPSGEHVVTSIDDIDPNECNWIHNINACEGGEQYPLPVADKSCGPGATVAITRDGQFSCLYIDPGTFNDEPVSQVVEPQPPVTSIDHVDPNKCSWVHNINACFSDGQAPADIPTNEYMTVLWLAWEDLSQRLAVEIGSIKLVDIERAGWPVYWPEEPEPGVAYIDIALPGFRMVLEANGQTYDYETDTSERVVFVG